jgi:hypothetical protein
MKKRLVEGMNALVLDCQMKSFSSRSGIVSAGRPQSVKRIAWMAPIKSVEAGTLCINASNGLPAFAEGYEPAWPLAMYHLEYKGELSEKYPITIIFNIDDFTFAREVNSFYILQWVDGSYQDITDYFDPLKRQVAAKITAPSDVVLMGASMLADLHSGTGKGSAIDTRQPTKGH